MFITTCSTCGAKLGIKDNKHIGKILPCPKCGGMVLVQSDETPTPPITLLQGTTIHKRFPDVLSHETASGIIGPVPEDHRRTDIFVDDDAETIVSEEEVKTRKILVGILCCLLVFLLAALGFMMLFRTPQSEQPQPPIPVLKAPVEPPPIKPDIKTEDDDIVIDGALSIPTISTPGLLTEMTVQEKFQNEPFQITGSTSFARENAMSDSIVPNIDIAEKLALPVLELNLRQQSLIEFVRVVSQLTGIPMTLDIDELKPLSLSVKTLVSGQFNKVTAEQILTETLAAVELQWRATDRQILIYPKVTDGIVDLTFEVSDFAEKTEDLKPDMLAEMVRRLVCPDENVAVLPDHRLTVTQSENSRKSPLRLRDDIRRFLEQLRAVRQLPRKTELREETLAPEAFGRDKVMEPVTLNYYQPVALFQVAAHLETMTNLTIIVDHQSLHRALCPFASVTTIVQCNQGTINDALALSLASVDSAMLDYRIIDHQTLEITTSESVRQPEKMVMEVHRYHLGEDETPEDIVRSLQLAVELESWEPTMRFGGDVMVDRPSSCLFVRQSQPAQRQIRLYLSESKPLAL